MSRDTQPAAADSAKLCPPGASANIGNGSTAHTPSPPAGPSLESRFRLASRYFALCAGFTGCAVLVGGWLLGFAPIRNLLAGAASMKPNTALCLVLLSMAILAPSAGGRTRSLPVLCAAFVMLLSLATLAEYAFGWDFGVDRFLIGLIAAPVEPGAPMRMAALAASGFFLLSAAILCQKLSVRFNCIEYLPLITAALCISNFVGYLYGIHNFDGIVFYTGMAVHTSCSLLLLSLSLLFSSPGAGLMAEIASENVGGLMARRMIPAGLIVPVFLGWLRWQGELHGFYGTAFGLAIFATSNVIVFVALTIVSASRLNRIDAEQAQTAALLQARESLLSTFVKNVPAAVAMLDREMRYLQVSDRWCTDYAIDHKDLIHRCHYDVYPDLPPSWKEVHRRCLAGETFPVEESRWDRANGSSIWLRRELRPWGADGAPPQGILIFTENITERKRIEEIVRQGEATIRALLDTAAQAILAVNGAGAIVLANRMAARMFGFDSKELLGKPVELLLPPGARARHAGHRASFVASPKTRPMGIGFELAGLRKDGSEFPVEVSLSYVDTAEGPLAVSFVTDITQRKQSETALRDSEGQLRALAGSLLTAQEDERRRLSRELHDDVTQQLAFLAIELGTLAKQPDYPSQETALRMRALHEQVSRLSIEVRRLSHGLHPSVIEDFGLGVALEEFCDEFAKAQKTTVRFDGFVDDLWLDSQGATCLYRIAQESLRNAVIHGCATEILVELTRDATSAFLRVKDNGGGFPVNSHGDKRGLGIISMEERIRQVNGTLKFSSVPGQGVEVTASVPLRCEKDESSTHSLG